MNVTFSSYHSRFGPIRTHRRSGRQAVLDCWHSCWVTDDLLTSHDMSSRNREVFLAASIAHMATIATNQALVVLVVGVHTVVDATPAAAVVATPRSVFAWDRDHCPGRRGVFETNGTCSNDVQRGCDPDVTDAPVKAFRESHPPPLATARTHTRTHWHTLTSILSLRAHTHHIHHARRIQGEPATVQQSFWDLWISGRERSLVSHSIR